jgi:hypothetical protein
MKRQASTGEKRMFEIRHDIHGFYVCTFLEADYEDEGNPSVGLDGRPHFETIEQAEQSIREESADRRTAWVEDGVNEHGQKMWKRTTNDCE